MKRITVYGSLLTGLGNHRLLDNEGATLLGEHTIEDNLVMLSLSAFPGLVISPEETNVIRVETYEVTDEVFKRVESLEGYPHFYTRYPVQTPFGGSEVYILANERYSNRGNRVPAGEDGVVSWKSYKGKAVW